MQVPVAHKANCSTYDVNIIHTMMHAKSWHFSYKRNVCKLKNKMSTGMHSFLKNRLYQNCIPIHMTNTSIVHNFFVPHRVR
jgi:hypothetical protein